MHPLIEWTAAVTVAVVLCAWRLLRGPEMTDRLLALTRST